MGIEEVPPKDQWAIERNSRISFAGFKGSGLRLVGFFVNGSGRLGYGVPGLNYGSKP